MAKKLASGGITLSLQTTIYDIQLAPFVVSIPTDANGNNPVLTGAKSKLVVSYKSTVIASVITGLITTSCTATHANNIVSITAISADAGQVQINFTVDGKALSAVFTWAKSKKGNTGDTGTPGVDAYSVILSNESHTLPASATGEVSTEELAKTRCSVRAFRGATELSWVAATATPGIGQFRYNIASVVGGTAIRMDNSSFALNSITGTDTAAVITIDVICEGKLTIQKIVTVARSKAGTPGAPGADGSTGPFTIDRGTYDPTSTYHGGDDYIELVMYGEPPTPFYTIRTAGSFSGILPTDSSKWKPFEYNFQSLYTKVLTAVTANINKLVVESLIVPGISGLTLNKNGDNLLTFRHLNGAEGLFIGIKDGTLKMEYFNENGQLSWKGDNQGYQNYNVPESWRGEQWLQLSTAAWPITAATASAIAASGAVRNNFCLGADGDFVGVSAATTYQRYSAGTVGNAALNGLHTTAVAESTNFIPNGYYVRTGFLADTQPADSKITFDVVYFQGGKEFGTAEITANKNQQNTCSF